MGDLASMAERIWGKLLRHRVYLPHEQYDDEEFQLTGNERKRENEVLQVLHGSNIVMPLETLWELKYVYKCMGPRLKWVWLLDEQVANAQDMGDGTFVIAVEYHPIWVRRPAGLNKPYYLISRGYLGYMDVFQFRKDVVYDGSGIGIGIGIGSGSESERERHTDNGGGGGGEAHVEG